MRTANIGARLAIGLLAAAGVSLSGCGGKTTVKADGAAQSVVDVVYKQTGFRPGDVHCPDGVEAKVGQQFDCHFTGPEGKAYVANLRITTVEGERVDFAVNTHPA